MQSTINKTFIASYSQSVILFESNFHRFITSPQGANKRYCPDFPTLDILALHFCWVTLFGFGVFDLDNRQSSFLP